MTDLSSLTDAGRIGDDVHALASKIFPICRSITGNGVRETLRILRGHLDIAVHEVPTGTRALDWTIPQEWNIKAASIRDTAGHTIVDFADHSLHVMSYSTPVTARLSLADLQEHLHSLPDRPDVIPYRTSYYQPNWGFCLPHRLRETLRDDAYDVVIDSSLTDGSLTYGEFYHRGRSADEILLSTHICHPSMANDNCAGLALLTHLAQRISKLDTRYSYRFLFVPATIGTIAWLSRNEAAVGNIKHGLVLSCIGDGGGPTYKKSRRQTACIDRVAAFVLEQNGGGTVEDFSPYGYDERQYCSPGYNLPVGLLQRSRFETFPEYHTSADTLDFVRPEHLQHSWNLVADILDVLEHDRRYRNLSPYGEPQLGPRGLYEPIGGKQSVKPSTLAYLWVLNLSDGQHSLLDIAERSRMPFATIKAAADRLHDKELLALID